MKLRYPGILLGLSIFLIAASCDKNGGNAQNNSPANQSAQGDAMHGDAMKNDAMKSDTMTKDDSMNSDASMKGDAMMGDAMQVDAMAAMNAAMTNPASKKIILSDVTGGSFTATAFVLRQTGKLTFTVSANLPDPAQGTFYQAWLVKNPASNEIVSAGKLSRQKDGSYESSLVLKSSYAGYDKVIITLEKDGGISPGQHLLEGSVQ